MSLHRGIDGSDPARPTPVSRVGGTHEERRDARGSHLATGTLACPRCDAPVALGAGQVSPGAPIACPFCAHPGAVRDFLSLASPSRPARVVVRVVHGARRAAR
ncbi:MAG: hypothetical protein QOF29_770 [bacterium]